MQQYLIGFFTPFFVWLYGGKYIPVDPVALFKSVLIIVLLPVVAGLLLRFWFKRSIEQTILLLPAFSVLIVALIVATVVALAHDRVVEAFGMIGIAVLLHNLLGLGLGYGFATL